MEYQPIQNILPDYENKDIKWGSKEINNLTEHQPLQTNYKPYITRNVRKISYDDYYDVARTANDLLNDLCLNSVIATLAINALIDEIISKFNEAVNNDDEEMQYICWVKYHNAFKLAEEMNLGSGAYLEYRKTFDNISKHIEYENQKLFGYVPISEKTNNIFQKLWLKSDCFNNISKERKQELLKENGFIRKNI